MPFPPPYVEFVRLFNAEEFWHGHEVLEGSWRKNGSTFYKGLIIFASAFVHAQRGNPTGVRKQMAKALRYLSPYAPNYLGLDVEALLRHATQCHDLAVRLEANPGAPKPRFSYCRMELDRTRVRGDESELSL